MRRLLPVAVLLIMAIGGIAYAQRGSNTQAPSETVAGWATDRSTVNSAGVIAAGGTFQQILPSIVGNAGVARQSITIQNNNTTSDNCWVFIGPIASATEAKSIILGPGVAYGRYWPNVPSDQISITCASTSDTFYADNQ